MPCLRISFNNGKSCFQQDIAGPIIPASALVFGGSLLFFKFLFLSALPFLLRFFLGLGLIETYLGFGLI